MPSAGHVPTIIEAMIGRQACLREPAIKRFNRQPQSVERSSDECRRPASICLDQVIDFSHQSNGLVKANDNPIEVSDVLAVQYSAFALFQPFRAYLIPTDVEVPDFLRYAPEACTAAERRLDRIVRSLLGIDPDRVIGPSRRANRGAARAFERNRHGRSGSVSEFIAPRIGGLLVQSNHCSLRGRFDKVHCH
jgi:hypothetical protein